MRFRDVPIKRKIVTVVMLTSMTVLVLTVAVFLIYDISTYRSTMVENISTIARITADNSTAAVVYDVKADAERVLNWLKAEPQIVAAAIYDPKGAVFARYPVNLPDSQLPRRVLKQGSRFEAGHLLVFEPIVQGDADLGTLYIRSNQSEFYRRLRLHAAMALTIMFAAGIFALLLSNVLQKRISEPVLALADTAHAVSAKHDYSVRAPRLSGDELGLLTDAFNQMLGRIQEQTLALRESEEGLRLALEASRTGTWYWDLETNKVSWDAYTNALYGLKPGQFNGTVEQFLELVHADDRVAVNATIEEALESKKGFVTEFRVVWPDGSLHYLASRGRALYDTAGRALRMTGVNADVTERKQAEEARAFLAAIVESTDDSIIGKDLHGRIISWNKGAERMFGYSAAEMIGQPVEKIVSPDRPDEEQRILSEVETGQIRHFETVRVTRDGRRIEVALTASPVRDSSGAIVGVSSISRDITERRQAARALEESQARLSGIIDSAMDAIISVDESQRITIFNSAAEKMFKLNASEAIGQPLDRFIPQRFRDIHRQHVAQFGQTGVTSREMGRFQAITGLRDTGGEFPIEASISQVETAGQKVYTVILRDITERKHSEEALERQTRVLREQAQMLDLANVLARDLQGRIILWNTGMEKMYGWSRDEALGQIGHELLRSGFPQPMQDIQAALLQHGHWEGELMHLRKDGRRIVVASQWVLHRDQHGQPAAVLEVNTDITERKMAEDQVRRMNVELEQRVQERTAELTAANRELEAFTYSVAHDLRAPLRHIDAFTKILHDEFGDALPREARRFLDNIRSGSRNMSRLVDDLLNLARVGRQELKRHLTPLNPIVDEVISELRRDVGDRNIEWRIGPLPAVECDPGLIKQVFANILSNSVKYTRPREKAVIEVGKIQRLDGTFIFVRDNGVGFNMKYVDKLFGVFQRLHRSEDFDGTGVGLATVDRIIRKHGGRIFAEAEVDKGAAFYFTLDGLAASRRDKNTESKNHEQDRN
jgi:PAS domain S-box-containing protein